MRNSSIDGAGVETYFTYDGLGSTADLTDDTATVTDTYSYDVFGDASHDSGSSDNDWLFTGEQHDGSEDLYYLRARYYDSATGRFLSQDPSPGLAGAPQSKNRYANVMNNPCSQVDPAGLAAGCNPVKTGGTKTLLVATGPHDSRTTLVTRSVSSWSTWYTLGFVTRDGTQPALGGIRSSITSINWT